MCHTRTSIQYEYLYLVLMSYFIQNIKLRQRDLSYSSDRSGIVMSKLNKNNEGEMKTRNNF